MEILKYPDRSIWEEIVKRPDTRIEGLDKTVQKIIDKVRTKGDKAIRKYSRAFDGVRLKELSVEPSEISTAGDQLPQGLRTAIQQAKKNIEGFHRSQKEFIRKVETMPGVVCWSRSSGIEKVGLYIPGGTAPLFSTVLMLGVPAQLAGCKEIILCTPPMKDGNVPAAILFAANLCGITKIFKVGGAQAIAAMAYGTASIPKVFKIFGPGNQYVTLAKQLIQKDVPIDMPAGPSELMVIADNTGNPQYIAADLLSQAEHGVDSQVIMVTVDETLAENTVMALAEQLEKLPRKDIARQCLKNSKLIVLKSIEEALALSDLYAPEHLILACADAEYISEKVNSAGSVFLGNFSPESAGDYASGTNHVLPTNGFARMYSGVSLHSFVKKISFQQLSEEGLANIGDTVMQMAEAENLIAHKQAIALRLKN
jgi:histidinol dehydrogenase